MKKINSVLRSLTSLQNAQKSRKLSVCLKNTAMFKDILVLLREHGYIKNFVIFSDNVKVFLKYSGDHAIIKKLIIYSPLNTKNNRSYKQIRNIMNNRSLFSGLSLTLFSTPKGILSEQSCLKHQVGGQRIITIL